MAVKRLVGITINIVYSFLIQPMHSICPVHAIFLDLITVIIFGEETIMKFLIIEFPVLILVLLHPSSIF
jgi:hypothetical protein